MHVQVDTRFMNVRSECLTDTILELYNTYGKGKKSKAIPVTGREGP
jgi:hypothetical protein